MQFLSTLLQVWLKFSFYGVIFLGEHFKTHHKAGVIEMRNILSLILAASLFFVTGCNVKTENGTTNEREDAPSSDPALGYPTLFTEQELMVHLTSIEEAIDHCYRLISVPTDMEFMRYTYRD